jgi:hypothetical protein
MLDNGAKLLNIYHQLTPGNKVGLSAWVHLAYFAENSARKSPGFGSMADGNYPEESPFDYLEAAERQHVPTSSDK